jgi:deoxyribodipyrimidine photolyase-related protein
LNSLEGFVRQVIGWREFVRGVWHALPASHWEQSFWGHERNLGAPWYDGTTGIPPLDDAIGRAVATGYNHHIERLMVLGNLMLLCRVRPSDAYRWFMEMFVDSADWVMAPNVYGMALFSEGGAFTTKPYICGSSYLRKMSDYPKGPWCEVVDGLYWAFVRDHRTFFEKNPRTKMMVRTLDRLADDRRQHIFGLAEAFIERVTT